MKGFVKDPDSTLDYEIDWTLWLDGDDISTSVWVAESGLTKVPASETNTLKTTKVFVSGGVVDNDYELKNIITTTGSRTVERTLEIRVRER